MTESLSTEKKLGMKASFIRWALDTDGIYNYPEHVLRQEMEDIDSYIGFAWVAWKAAWRKRR